MSKPLVPSGGKMVWDLTWDRSKSGWGSRVRDLGDAGVSGSTRAAQGSYAGLCWATLDYAGAGPVGLGPTRGAAKWDQMGKLPWSGKP